MGDAVAAPGVPPELAARVAGLVRRGSDVDPGVGSSGQPVRAWNLAALSGRLTELSGPSGSGLLTLAFSLVLDAQRAQEPVAWLTPDESVFFPPDVAASGVDLDALVVVRLPDPAGLARAAEHLARSGAFGLLVVDLVAHPGVPAPMLVRLLGLAREHESAFVFLSRKGEGDPSLGPLVSLRAEVVVEPPPFPGGPWDRLPFQCVLRVLKDKRGGLGWTHTEVCRGPDGLL